MHISGKIVYTRVILHLLNKLINAMYALKQGKKVKYALNSNDRLFSDVRDKNFTIIGPTLNQRAKDIDEYYKVSGLGVRFVRRFSGNDYRFAFCALL